MSRRQLFPSLLPRRPARRRTVKRQAQAQSTLLIEALESRRLLAVCLGGTLSHDEVSACAEQDPDHGTVITADGRVMVACPVPLGDIAPVASATQVLQAPLGDTFALHSRPTATKVIYLDFDGHTTSGTAWKGGDTCVTPAYDTDGNTSAFTDTELRNIQDIWARVVEDFSPFDVDVTTESPSIDDLRKFGAGDSRWGVRVAIGGSYSDWYGNSAGGVAYVGSFTWDSDTPCFVFSRNTGNGNPKSTAEAVSHEVGHTLGLVHDGRTIPSEGYYTGHGSGATGWAPIMGVGYYKELVQWSKGEYANANNTEDDLAIITTRNGFGYRIDDYGGTLATARVLPALGATPTVVQGVIEQSSDVDVFQFVTSGTCRLSVSPAAISPNLDVLAEIWNAAGSVLYTSNPLDALGASFDLSVSAGGYFLAVKGTGKGEAAGTGYSSYASLGQYTLSIEEVTIQPPTFSIAAKDARKSEGNSGTTPFTFSIFRSGSTVEAARIDWAVRGRGQRPTTADDFVGNALPGGTATFAAGATTATVVVPVQGDLFGEWEEGFAVDLSNPSVGTIQVGTADGAILNDDSTQASLSIAATQAFKAEGNSGTTLFDFTITRAGWIAESTTVTWSVVGSGSRPTNQDDFQNRVFPTGLVVFSPGELTKTISVAVLGDTNVETDETFNVKIASPGSTLGASFATGTIRDDDGSPVFVISTADSRKPEGHSGTTAFTFTVTRLVMTATPAVVNWAVSAFGPKPANAADFAGGTFPKGSVDFAPNETSQTVTVNVAGDTTIEEDEGFAVTISTSTPNSRVRIPTAYGTIVNDDVVPLLAIAATDARKNEGNSGTTSFTFTVYRSRYTAIPTDFSWSVAGSGAVPATANDFVGNAYPAGTVRFNVGETTKTITVSVNGDTTYESDERFVVTIASQRAAVGTATAIGTILNDDMKALLAAAVAGITSGEASPGKPRPRS